MLEVQPARMAGDHATLSGYSAKPEGYFGHTRTEVLRLLPQKVGRIVDIGGGSGATLSLIKQNFPDVVTICMDHHAASVATARQRGHIGIVCDVESGIPDEIGECDAVLCLDVLEHLIDPWKVLRNLYLHMKPAARIVLSVPNVRYLPVSAGLLFKGRWELTSEGVLDSTHLRFFTRSSALAMLRNAGFELIRIEAKLGPVRRGVIADTLTLGLLRDLFSIQFLLVGTR